MARRGSGAACDGGSLLGVLAPNRSAFAVIPLQKELLMPDFVDPKQYRDLNVTVAAWSWDKERDSPIVDIEFENGTELRFRVIDENLKMEIDRDLHLGPASENDDELNALVMQRHIAEGHLIPESNDDRGSR